MLRRARLIGRDVLAQRDLRLILQCGDAEQVARLVGRCRQRLDAECSAADVIVRAGQRSTVVAVHRAVQRVAGVKCV